MNRIIYERAKLTEKKSRQALPKIYKEEFIMKKIIIAVSAAAIIMTGAITAMAAGRHGGVCPNGYDCSGAYCQNGGYCQNGEYCPNYENCPNNGERPLDGTGMQYGRGGHCGAGRACSNF